MLIGFIRVLKTIRHPMKTMTSDCGAARRRRKFLGPVRVTQCFLVIFRQPKPSSRMYFDPIQDSVFVQKELKRRMKS